MRSFKYSLSKLIFFAHFIRRMLFQVETKVTHVFRKQRRILFTLKKGVDIPLDSGELRKFNYEYLKEVLKKF